MPTSMAKAIMATMGIIATTMSTSTRRGGRLDPFFERAGGPSLHRNASLDAFELLVGA